MALKRHAIMRQDSSASMDDYCLDRLFDPEELYYTPMDELLKRYKTRNLRPGRMFNMAKRYGHIQELRKRNILAPLTDIYEAYGDGIVKPQKLTCSPLKKTEKNLEDKEKYHESEKDEERKQIKHALWLQERKNLRNGLNNLDLNQEYLKRKTNLNECELRVLKQLEHEIESEGSKKVKNPKKTNRLYKKEIAKNNEEISRDTYDLGDIGSEVNNDMNQTKLPHLNAKNSHIDNQNSELMSRTKDSEHQSLEEKKAELFTNSLDCYKKASLLDIANVKVLKKALIFPQEIKSANIIEKLKEKAINEKKEKQLQRYLMKRGKLLQRNN